MRIEFKLLFLLISAVLVPSTRCDRDTQNSGGLFGGSGGLFGGSGGILGSGSGSGGGLFQTLILLRLLSSVTGTTATTSATLTTPLPTVASPNVVRVNDGTGQFIALNGAPVVLLDSVNNAPVLNSQLIAIDPITGFLYDTSTNRVVVFLNPVTNTYVQAIATPSASGRSLAGTRPIGSRSLFVNGVQSPALGANVGGKDINVIFVSPSGGSSPSKSVVQCASSDMDDRLLKMLLAMRSPSNTPPANLRFQNGVFTTVSTGKVVPTMFDSNNRQVPTANLAVDPITGAVYDTTTNSVVYFTDPSTNTRMQAFVYIPLFGTGGTTSTSTGIIGGIIGRSLPLGSQRRNTEELDQPSTTATPDFSG